MVSLLFCNWVHSVYCRGLSHGEEADQLAVAASVACAIAGARGRLRRETNTINGVALGADMSYAAKYFQLASCVITVACLFEVFPNVCKL